MTTPQQRANQESADAKETVKQVKQFSESVKEKSMTANELQRAWEDSQS